MQLNSIDQGQILLDCPLVYTAVLSTQLVTTQSRIFLQGRLSLIMKVNFSNSQIRRAGHIWSNLCDQHNS